MRTFLILTISLLAPYALYTAGCNQNRQAAFPNTPEMKALAYAPDQGAAAQPPIIPAAIDREILASAPDAATRARLQAVNDRSSGYAGAPSGMFALPPENQTLAAAPSPSAREFWSRPVAPVAQPARQPQQRMLQDVSAMAPAYHGAFEPLPEPITTGPAVPFSAAPLVTQSPVTILPVAQPPAAPRQMQVEPVRPMAPPAAAVGMLPPPVTRAPAGPAAPNPVFAPPPEQPYSLRPGEKLLPPESVPGVFMGTDAGDLIQPDAPKFAANSTAGTGLNAAPPLLSAAARDTAAVRDLNLMGKDGPTAAPQPASPVPPASRASSRLEALLKNDDPGQALAPLPALAAAPAPLAAAPAAPAAPAVKEAGSLFMPPPPVIAGGRDSRRMDVRDDRESALRAAMAPLPEVKPKAPPTLPPLPAFDEPVDAKTDGLRPPEDFAKTWESGLSKSESPQRVLLKPARAKQELQGIDSSIDVPPMRF